MKNFGLGILILLGLNACVENDEKSQSASESGLTKPSAKAIDQANAGFEVEILHEGSGAMPSIGDMVTVHYTGRLSSSGEVFDSSLDRGQPFSFAIGKGQVIRGWDVGIAQLNVGSKAVLRIPANMAYGERATESIPPNSDLEFEVDILNIEPAPKPMNHEVYSAEGVEAQMTNSGIKYYVLEQGDGAAIEAGSKVKVHYYGYFLESGEKFDSSFDRGQPIELLVGTGQVIKGWEESLMLLRAGAKAKVEIPSALAYGERGYPGVIPPNTDLVFDMQIMKVQ